MKEKYFRTKKLMKFFIYVAIGNLLIFYTLGDYVLGFGLAMLLFFIFTEILLIMGIIFIYAETKLKYLEEEIHSLRLKLKYRK